MKKLSIRMTALLIALLMALTFVFVGCDEDGNVEYSLDSNYVEFSYIVDPSLAENQGFQSMISRIKESDVDVTFVLDSDGALRYLSADVEVDLGDMQTMIDEDIEIITINGIVEFDEPDWVANAK